MPGMSTYQQIHNNIIPRKQNFTHISLVHESKDADALPVPINVVANAPTKSVTANIDKNEIIDCYSNYCKTLGFTESVTTKKVSTNNLHQHPTCYQNIPRIISWSEVQE
jgi:hypothetical protein